MRRTDDEMLRLVGHRKSDFVIARKMIDLENLLFAFLDILLMLASDLSAF